MALIADSLSRQKLRVEPGCFRTLARIGRSMQFHAMSASEQKKSRLEGTICLTQTLARLGRQATP